MSAPPFARWHVWAGNDPGTVLRLRDGSGLLDLTGATVVLTITRGVGDVLVLRSGTDAAVSIPDQTVTENRGQIEVRLSLVQGRDLPLSTAMPFELEVWRAGVQRTWLQGEMLASTRNNVDA
jgi:hypothetical protein